MAVVAVRGLNQVYALLEYLVKLRIRSDLSIYIILIHGSTLPLLLVNG